MEELTRFYIAEYNGISMVVVESQFLPPDASIVVIPLLPDYPSVSLLNPKFSHNGTTLVLATRLIAGVRRASLRKTGDLKRISGQSDIEKITKTIIDALPAQA